MEKLEERIAYLPDGQKVRIEIIYEDGYASVRRIDGEWEGMLAICAVERLLPDGESVEG